MSRSTFVRIATLATILIGVNGRSGSAFADAAPPPPKPPVAPATPAGPAAPTAPVAPVPPAPPAPAAGADMQGPPPPRPAITNEYLKSLVGSWDVGIHSPQGGDQKGSSTIRMALDGTAVVEEMSDGAAFSGMGVEYVAADGKGLSVWWFDAMQNGGTWPWKGSFVEGGYDLSADSPDGKKATIAMRRKGEGHFFEMRMNGESFMTLAYTKAAKAAAPATIARDKGPKSALVDLWLGDWTVSGVTVIESMKMEVKHEGSSSFRLGVGGAYLLQDYEITSPMEHAFVLGVYSFGADGKSARSWNFINTMDGPLMLPGVVDGTTARFAVAKGPFGGAMEAVMTKKGEGVESLATIEIPGGKVVVTETYSRGK